MKTTSADRLLERDDVIRYVRRKLHEEQGRNPLYGMIYAQLIADLATERHCDPSTESSDER